ncbi:FAD-binding oxidoreductase [Spirulina major CS-329]|uniref:FAD-binding oxidoreductase n=1 Tax=Spirulina TaxID=1154 RepID=UPI00232AAFC6|nr:MULTISPECIES: FAD-binding oxidoreductase [Spirulina]MDB9494290.1 FAD-binding oxidoreductase [Spirulina subsalsa CS-330]MDB9502374.1 FAD-binding oxidoreductase [Spirulina major CS-329]
MADSLPLIADLDPVDESTVTPPWRDRLTALDLTPPQLLFPQTLPALQAVIRHLHHSGGTMRPCGTGTKLTWGGIGRPVDYLVSGAALDRVIDHAVGDLTITVEAGISLAAVQAHLAPTGQFLPLDPAYPDQATLGGIVATADAGSWRQRYGGVRDLLLGMTMVRADGAIAKAGGRVVKNVAGYDLMKLLTGSFGTLGMLAELTFRTYPRPETMATRVLTGSAEAIATTTQTLLNSTLTPVRLDLLNGSLVRAGGGRGALGLGVEFASIAASVAVQLDQLDAIATQQGLTITTPAPDFWDTLTATVRTPAHRDAITARFGVLPAALPDLLANLPTTAIALGNGGSGLGFCQFPAGITADQLRRVRRQCAQQRGFFTLLDAPAALKQTIDPWGYPGNAIALMRQVKQSFDPQNGFSPGIFVDGI